jgi:hypothetical protein
MFFSFFHAGNDAKFFMDTAGLCGPIRPHSNTALHACNQRRDGVRKLRLNVGSPAGKDYFLRVAKRTTGIASINKTQLSALPVPVPAIELQRAFEQKLSDLRSIQRLGNKATEAALQTANAASAAYFAG